MKGGVTSHLMAKPIFRQVALERLSSPEQLDQLITITNPIGWIALLVSGGLLLAATLWGVYGNIPTNVQGQGIILKKGGLVTIQAQNSGTITALNVEVGALVQKGEAIARIQQDALLEQIRKAELDLKNLEATYQEKNKTQTEAAQIQLKKLQQDQRNQNQDIKNLESQLQTKLALKKQQEELLASVQNLSKEGVFSKNKVIETKNEIIAMAQAINTLQAEIEKAKNQLNSLLLAINELSSTQSLDALAQQQKIEALQMNLRLLQKNFTENSQITSPASGRVLEITARIGTLVTAGAAVALLEQQAQEIDFEVVAYFSPLIGKQIQEGMPAQISPSFVKREEYGFMAGTVRQVDRYPSTLNAVLKDIQNDSLARLLTQDTAPIKVVIALIPDKTALSGYQWSSRQGPPIEIQSGTICATDVTVKTQPPMTLVLPFFKKYLFGSQTPQNPS